MTFSSKAELRVFTNLYTKKQSCDRFWDEQFRRALHGEIDKELLASAMDQCNKAEWALMEFERMKKVINKGKEGYSDIEWEKKYIDPYREPKKIQ